MDWDELEPKKKPQQAKDLSLMGVKELEEYIATLKAEITRAETEVSKRGSTKDAAEAFFRKGTT